MQLQLDLSSGGLIRKNALPTNNVRKEDKLPLIDDGGTRGVFHAKLNINV